MRLGLAVCFGLIVGVSHGVFAQDIALIGVKLYPNWHAVPETNTTILVQAGKVAAIGKNVLIPARVRVLPCHSCIVFAGFWNAHVHFTGSQWDDAAGQPANRLTCNLQTMLTHSGFTTVVDLASDPTNTVALRRRIESGEVQGPTIYTAGSGLYPPDAIPFYLNNLPRRLREMLPRPSTPAAAVQAVERNLASGTDVVKLFTGAYRTPDTISHMPLLVAKAAVSDGHKHHQLVFAHPSDLGGVVIAMESDVDVLAHAPDTVGGVDDALVSKLVARHMTMIPTLKLFSASKHIRQIRRIVRQFHRAGGRMLFGTDVGFLTDYDVSEEFRQLQLSGLSFRDVLSMLTAGPALEFGISDRAGTVKPGGDGDLTVLSVNPDSGDLRNFSHVLYAIRAGRVIFDATSSHEPGC